MPSESKFFQAVADPDVFELDEFNLFKVFYVDFFFRKEVNRRAASWQGAPHQAPLRMLAGRVAGLLRLLAWLIRFRFSLRRQPDVFYGASGRLSVVNGVTYDLYNARIVAAGGRDRFVIIQDTFDRSDKVFPPDLCLSGLSLLIRVLRPASRWRLGKRLSRFVDSMTAACPDLGYSRDEAENLVVTFWSNYLAYRWLLARLRPERVLLTCHYGREAFIAACKHLHVPIIELQHGAILPGHAFYTFPAGYGRLFERALFPDWLAVYGSYWRDVAAQGGMFPPDRIDIAGYYLKTTGVETVKRSNVPTILITTQPTVQTALCDYIRFLAAELDPAQWRVVIKPHPAEDAAAYEPLLRPDFISMSRQDVYALLGECQVHISAYSTVLFEAVRFGVANYAFFTPAFEAFSQAVVDSGVARPLRPGQLPVLQAPPVPVERFLAEFDPGVLGVPR